MALPGNPIVNQTQLVQAVKDALTTDPAKPDLNYLGDKLGLNDLGQYKPFVPKWSSTGTQPSFGNGGMLSRYVQIGKFVHYTAIISFGSTTTFGTGAWIFSLPVPQVDGAHGGVGRALGMVDGIHAATGARLLGLSEASAGGHIPFYASTYLGPGTNITFNAPWTWGSGDFIAWNLTYQAA